MKGAKQDDKDKVLSDKAKKRDDLITESRLKKELRVSEVISPVSNLIKEKIPIFLDFIYSNEK